MKRIPVSGGRAFALVDDSDYDALMPWRWSLHTAGYAVRNAAGRPVYMHRQILGLAHGDEHRADHINANPLDNRRANLRICSAAANAQNRAPRRFGTSRFRGVYFHKRTGRWMARVKVDYRHRYLGEFDDEVEAAKVAEAYRREHMPFATPDAELAHVLALRAGALPIFTPAALATDAARERLRGAVPA